MYVIVCEGLLRNLLNTVGNELIIRVKEFND